MNLVELATGYLESLGYETILRGRDTLIGYKLAVAGEREGIIVFIPSFKDDQPFTTKEGSYLSRFHTAAKEYPRAQKFMLVPTFEGISRDFRIKAKSEFDVNLRVPILFFDSPFKIEESSEARAASSAARELNKLGEFWASHRVPQPYDILVGNDNIHSNDILNIFEQKILKRQGSGLNLVVAPAGMGKSVFFQVLFSSLYSSFQRYKSQLRIFPRPLPLIPEYLRASLAYTLKGLLEGFIRTEFAAPISFETFQWMLVNGFGIWMLDGLDEIIERDPGFFFDLLDILTKPGTENSIVLLCLRDSLLSSNQELNDFLDEYQENITIYELCKWDKTSKRKFAKLEFAGQKAEEFIATIQSRKTLDDLCSIPYYCKLIADEYRAERLKESYNETELLESAIGSLMEREYKKDLLDKSLIPIDALIELLQNLASEDAGNGFQGLKRETIKEYTEIVLPTALELPTQERLITQMVQLAIFSQGAATGSIQFSQEILEHYLYGEHIYRCFCNNEDLAIRSLSIQLIPSDWVTLKVIAYRIKKGDQTERLIHWLKRGDIPDIAFRNIVQICAYATVNPAMLKMITFETKNLGGVRFFDLDLRDVSFRQCDLTDVEFNQCLLHNAKFESSIINRTLFLLRNKDDLKRASFGDMERIYSIRVQPKKPGIDNKVAREWLKKHTGLIKPTLEPCNAALQLRYLFGKYIYPNGKAKRAILDKRGTLSGKEFFNREKTLNAAVKHGYLIPDTLGRGRFQRCDGDSYNEILNYVKDFTLTLNLINLLNDICDIPSCQHVPKL